MVNNTLTPIGVIHSPYKTKAKCPIQGAAQPLGRGTVEVFPEYAAGLKNIDLFTHLILLYQFDRAGEVELVRKPFMDDAEHGLFAMRHPCRPNGIGFSIVRLEGVEGNLLHISRVDVLDGTPLLDIKPYVPKFDGVEGASNGWLEKDDLGHKPAGRE